MLFTLLVFLLFLVIVLLLLASAEQKAASDDTKEQVRSLPFFAVQGPVNLLELLSALE